MDELKQQFYEVMHKYQKPFSEEGVTANLTQWYEQKQGLLQLLRRHPLWNEKELAIVFRVEERREIDRITVDETRAAILELGRRACTDDTVYENFETALRAATADYARIPNEYRLDTIRQYGDIKCAPGQKASRIINRLCLKFHLDQIEEEAEAGEPDNRYMRTVKPYNALFARLADALNPAHIEKTAVLSIHPCDFLEMSNRDNTWSSCHCLEGGGYRGGCQSYMGDAVSMIFFTVSDEYTQDFHTAPRITREIFCYKDNVLLQSRLYPTDLEDQKTLYRSIVQQAIATCLDKPNLWSLKRGKDTEPYCESAADSNHYPDYKYGYAVASLLKGENDYGQMTIGSVARCVCCGGEQKKVHRYVPKLKAAVLTENAIAVMPDGKKARYDSQKAKCQKVVPLSRALEILNTLLQQTVQSNSLQDNAEDDTTMQSIDMSSALEDEETISPNIQISLGLEDLLRLYCIGFFIIVVSVTVSSVSVMRLKPRDILNRMS